MTGGKLFKSRLEGGRRYVVFRNLSGDFNQGHVADEKMCTERMSEGVSNPKDWKAALARRSIIREVHTPHFDPFGMPHNPEGMNHPLAARLLELLKAHPFQPFSIRLVDGSVYSVPYEDFLSVTKSGNVVFDDGRKDLQNDQRNAHQRDRRKSDGLSWLKARRFEVGLGGVLCSLGACLKFCLSVTLSGSPGGRF